MRIARSGPLWACLAVSLGGCAGSAPLAEIVSALVEQEWGSQDDAQRVGTPNPAYRYLRVEAQGRAPAFMVLGYVDAHPQGDIEVWYSSKRELLKIQNGRIVGTAGLEVDWRAVQFPLAPPPWTALPAAGATFQRTRDEMPGHRYSISEQMELRPWQGLPPIGLPTSLGADQARGYTWFRETTRSSTADAVPPAWFAWGLHRGTPTVVYSEQCLSDTFCLKLQRWPLQEGGV